MLYTHYSHRSDSIRARLINICHIMHIYRFAYSSLEPRSRRH